eukprot:gene49917-46909_t
MLMETATDLVLCFRPAEGRAMPTQEEYEDAIRQFHDLEDRTMVSMKGLRKSLQQQFGVNLSPMKGPLRETLRALYVYDVDDD